MTTPSPNEALASPPWVVVQGIPNFRDLGGYEIDHLPSHSVRTGYIYRAGEPTKVTQQGIDTMTLCGITHIYDLRSAPEIERNRSAGKGDVVEWKGCQRVFAPVFLDTDYSPQNLVVRFRNYAAEGTEGFTLAYTDILDNAPRSYSQILLHIAKKPTEPLIIHCTAGKDRTGVLCALILSLCRVADKTVAYEYSLTELGLAEWKEKKIEELMANSLLNFERSGALNMFSAKASNMLATLHMIRERYGGVEQYMIQQCKLTREDIELIKRNLIVEMEPVHKPILL